MNPFVPPQDDHSCDICHEDDACNEKNEVNAMSDVCKAKLSAPQANSFEPATEGGSNTASGGILKNARPEKLNISFDHLSVVSEECLSNSDEPADGHQKRARLRPHQPPSPSSDTSAEICFAEFQSKVPSLAHFENLPYEDIGPNVGKCSYERIAADAADHAVFSHSKTAPGSCSTTVNRRPRRAKP